MAFFATVICQFGAALACLPEGSIMHFPTLKTTAAVAVMALFSSGIIYVIYEWVVDYGKHAAFWTLTLALILLAVAVLSLFNPMVGDGGRIAFRYPTIAAMLCGELLVEFFGGKVKPHFGLPKFDIKEPGNVFFLIASITGISLCFILPHETVLNFDDESHYRDSVYFSQGIYTAFNNADTREFFWFWDHDTGLSATERASNDEALNAGDSDGSLYMESGLAAYDLRKVGYIGTTFAMWIGNALHLNAVARFILARIGNLMLYAFVMSLAIKRLKNGKMLLFLTALCPYMIYSAACFNYDAWMSAFLSLGLACFFEAVQTERKVSNRDLAVMAGSMFLAFLPKAPYAVLMLILFFLPKKCFRDPKQRKRFYAILIAAVVFLFLYTVATSFGIGDPVDERGNSNDNISGYGQMVYVFSHLGTYISTLIRFFFGGYLGGQGYLGQFGSLGGTKAYLVTLSAMIFAAITDSGKAVKAIPVRIAGTIICFLTLMAAATVMYLVFTPVGSNTVLGFQERYMVHLLFPFLMFALNGWLKFDPPRKIYNLVFYIIGIAVLVYNISEIVVIPSLC